MFRQILKESLIVVGGILFFLTLCATVGISLSTRDTVPTVAADEQESDSKDVGAKQPGSWIGNYPGGQGSLFEFCTLLFWIVVALVAVGGAGGVACMIGLIWSELHPR